jgi:Tfp pilus assembly protein FimT
MLNYREKKLGFSKIELLLWISILAVLTFLMIPFYNSWKNEDFDFNSSKE